MRGQGDALRPPLCNAICGRNTGLGETYPPLAEPAPHTTDDDNEDRHGRADHRTRFVHALIIALVPLR
jgi:hypothetical protein